MIVERLEDFPPNEVFILSKVAIELFEPRSFDAGVADEIVALVEETLDGAEFCSIALSGGSTPAGVYRALSKPPRVDQVDWSRLKVFWSDDRFVPHSDSQSNYRLAYETLLSQLSPGPQVFAVDITQSTAELAAESYQRSLIREVPCDGDGVPELDIVLLGMGTDGHTASLFPGAESSHALCLSLIHI